jgi:hypothetical protein
MESLKLKFDFHRDFFAAKTGMFAGLRKLVCLGGVAMLLAGCRLDMHVQPKYLPYEPSNFFDDGRSERPVVPGTVARGQLHTDELLYTGKENGVVSDKFPFPMTRADLHSVPRLYGQRPRHDRAARLSASAFLSSRKYAAGASGTLF